jgi:hypothetical protein
MRTVDFLVRLNQEVLRRTAYIVRMEPGIWDPERTLGEGRGSCRDSAWLMVQALRHLGLAARFCSGYLIQLVADQKPVEGRRGRPPTSPTCHAWAEVYLPGAGWVGLDATSGLMTGEGHIPLAATPEPQSAAPISGLVEPAETEFGFEMEVRRVANAPRVTKPYTPAQWAGIRPWAAAWTRRWRRFASPWAASPPSSPPPTARRPSGTPTRSAPPSAPSPASPARLGALWGPGHVIHTGQGKQYPGEPLPRFALSCHWRRDGVPVWNDPGLLAGDDDTDNATAEDAAAFARDLAQRLGLDPARVIRAHEDVHYYLWREERLPANVTAESSKLADPLERARFARLFRATSPLPWAACCRSPAGRRLANLAWQFRGGTLFLTPGDAPMGLRLPLNALPWKTPDAGDGRRGRGGPLREAPAAAGSRRGGPAPRAAPESRRRSGRHARSASSRREGKLHAFCRRSQRAPTGSPSSRRRGSAAAASVAGWLEGYAPPATTASLTSCGTPDPGVLEVNLHPAASWPEMEERTLQLYEEARQLGLAAEKFMLDGRHVGTGGGNHVVMGAAASRTAPSCAGRTCCARCSASGTTIPRSPSCSAACSSARPASIRAWTRPAWTACASWRSPSASSTARARKPRPG